MRSNRIFASQFVLPVLTSLSNQQQLLIMITTPTQSGFSLLGMPFQRWLVMIVIGQSLSKVR